MRRRELLGTTMGLGVAGLSGRAETQPGYPSRPIRFIVPYAPGGLTDVLARALAEEARRGLNVPIPAENRSGGNTLIGMQAVATAPPDGYTIGMVSGSTMVALPALMGSQFPFPADALEPVTMLYRGPMILAVRSDFPAQNLKELVSRSRESQRSLTFGCSAIGGLPHLVAELFGEAAGIAVEPVPYRNEAAVVTDMLAGSLPALFGVLQSVNEHLSGGAIRVLAVTSTERIAALPDVPTFAEAGFPSVKGFFWQALVAPPRTPEEALARLQDIFASAIRLPAMKEKLTSDVEIVGSDRATLRRAIAEDTKVWGEIIRSRNIQLR